MGGLLWQMRLRTVVILFTDAKRLFKFDIGDLVEVKYKHPRPQNNIQKQLVGKKLKGLVMNFQVFNFQVSFNESILLYYDFLSLRFVFCRFRNLAKELMVNSSIRGARQSSRSSGRMLQRSTYHPVFIRRFRMTSLTMRHSRRCSKYWKFTRIVCNYSVSIGGCSINDALVHYTMVHYNGTLLM